MFFSKQRRMDMTLSVILKTVYIMFLWKRKFARVGFLNPTFFCWCRTCYILGNFLSSYWTKNGRKREYMSFTDFYLKWKVWNLIQLASPQPSTGVFFQCFNRFCSIVFKSCKENKVLFLLLVLCSIILYICILKNFKL